MQKAAKDGGQQSLQTANAVLSAIDELPFPMMQATEEQMMQVMEQVIEGGKFLFFLFNFFLLLTRKF